MRSYCICLALAWLTSCEFLPFDGLPSATLGLGGDEGFIDLAEADGIYREVNDGDRVGNAISCGGDVSGDGQADLVVAAAGLAHEGGSGAVYVVHGPAMGDDSLANADSRLLTDVGFVSEFAFDLDSSGDVDADGTHELLVGTGFADDFNGSAYLNYGPVPLGTTPLADADVVWPGVGATGTSVYLASTDGEPGADAIIGGSQGPGAVHVVEPPAPLSSASTRFVGENDGDGAGSMVLAVPDLRGEGGVDVVVGAETYDLSGLLGRVYVAPLEPGDVALADVAHTITGQYRDGIGGAAAWGDFNGDGQADLALGARRSGRVYVIAGPITGDIDLSDGSVVMYRGEGDAGFSIAAGDVDGDGTDELLVGAPGITSEAGFVGAAYLLWDPLDPRGEDTLGSRADREFGGAGAQVLVGRGASMGDLDGDGLDDLCIGAAGNLDAQGRVYVVHGASL